MRRIWFLRMTITVVVISCCIFSLWNFGYAWFISGQKADMVLSSPGFNNAGYLSTPGDGLLFNHPMNITADGTHLLLADTRNNRILIWNSLPTGNVPPDLVLGQDNLTTNNPGTDLNRLNWPVGVSAAGSKVVVADTYNNRILIWNIFPTTNAKAADFYISLPAVDPSRGFSGAWPWAVWTNGTKLIVCATQASEVFIWNTFPTTDKAPDIILTGKNPTTGVSSFGTPRTIGTDGSTYLVIGDHNANVASGQESASFVWKSFPSTSDQPYDFKMHNPGWAGWLMWGGQSIAGGKFVAFTPPGISIWNSLPSSDGQQPNLFVGGYVIRDVDEGCFSFGYHFHDGDGTGMVIAPTGQVYVSLPDGNKVVGYNSLPTSTAQCPDFAIGSPDINTNTYKAASFMNNPWPATDGSGLYVIAGIDFKLNVWNSLPTQSSVKPDAIYDTGNLQLNVSALSGNTFVAAGLYGTQQQVLVWKSLPPKANADLTFSGSIGTASFQNIQGVALDDKYLYLADQGAGKIYVWNALPDAGTPPLFSLNVPQIGRISSDGKYLVGLDGSRWTLKIYRVSTLSSIATPVAELPAPGASYSFASPPGPTGCLVANNHLFISDTTAGRVLCWRSIDAAIAGKDPDAVLGQPDLFQGQTESIAQNRLFWPATLAFDGKRLWVGEWKFSSRLVGFKPMPDNMPWLMLLLGN
ncbi:MAG: hypothetical protein ABSE95_14230 [Thermodesulfobacteriota bacterium]|jgi:hypothetical protein